MGRSVPARRVVGRVGLAMVILGVVVLLVSGRWHVAFGVPASSWRVSVSAGCLAWHSRSADPAWLSVHPQSAGLRHWNDWRWRSAEATPKAVGSGRGGRLALLVIPIYAPLLLLAPTLLLLRGRPASPSRCGCGYDLTGNVSGVCPECGRRRTPTDSAVPSGRDRRETT